MMTRTIRQATKIDSARFVPAFIVLPPFRKKKGKARDCPAFSPIVFCYQDSVTTLPVMCSGVKARHSVCAPKRRISSSI